MRTQRCLSDRPNAIVAIGEPLDEREVLRCADHRARVAGQHDDGKGAEDGVDGAPFEPKLAQVRSREQRVRSLEQLLRRWMLATRSRPLGRR